MADAATLVVYMAIAAVVGGMTGFALAMDVIIRHGRVRDYVVVAVDPEGIEVARRSLASASEVARN